MSMILALETSSSQYGVAVGTPEELLAERTVRRGTDSFPGVGHVVAETLESAGAAFADLTHLAVDVGPGNLSSVRTGIAYTNGLAFSLNLQIFCANSLALLALETGDGSVLCLRKAGGGNAYAGLFRHGATLGLRHGPLPDVVASLCRDQSGVPAGEEAAWRSAPADELSVAGSFRSEVAALLPEARVKDTGVEVPQVATLHRLLATTPDWETGVVSVASPLTETSSAFNE